MKKTSKILIILIIVILLIAAGGVFTYIYLATDLLKSEQQLFFQYIEQLSAEDVAEEPNKETNFSLNINLNDNSLGNSAWDLVKRHKESK